MNCHASVSGLQCLEYFKSGFLEIQNVTIRTIDEWTVISVPEYTIYDYCFVVAALPFESESRHSLKLCMDVQANKPRTRNVTKYDLSHLILSRVKLTSDEFPG